MKKEVVPATTTVDDYLSRFDGEVLGRMREMRRVIKVVAPQADEEMSYGMPAYKLGGKPLVYFAGYPHHIGFYATPNGHEAFKKEFASYKQGKGSVQFSHDQELPLDLVRKVVLYRLKVVQTRKE